VASDLAQRGCRVMFVSPDASLSPSSVAPDDEPVVELLAMLLRFYLAANAEALRRGRSPDRPPLLSKITETR
jgi:glucosamine--fructose-6-phosphate aminotransferase (isomerizing)